MHNIKHLTIAIGLSAAGLPLITAIPMPGSEITALRKLNHQITLYGKLCFAGIQDPKLQKNAYDHFLNLCDESVMNPKKGFGVPLGPVPNQMTQERQKVQKARYDHLCRVGLEDTQLEDHAYWRFLAICDLHHQGPDTMYPGDQMEEKRAPRAPLFHLQNTALPPLFQGLNKNTPEEQGNHPLSNHSQVAPLLPLLNTTLANGNATHNWRPYYNGTIPYSSLLNNTAHPHLNDSEPFFNLQNITDVESNVQESQTTDEVPSFHVQNNTEAGTAITESPVEDSVPLFKLQNDTQVEVTIVGNPNPASPTLFEHIHNDTYTLAGAPKPSPLQENIPASLPSGSIRVEGPTSEEEITKWLAEVLGNRMRLGKFHTLLPADMVVDGDDESDDDTISARGSSVPDDWPWYDISDGESLSPRHIPTAITWDAVTKEAQHTEPPHMVAQPLSGPLSSTERRSACGKPLPADKDLLNYVAVQAVNFFMCKIIHLWHRAIDTNPTESVPVPRVESRSGLKPRPVGPHFGPRPMLGHGPVVVTPIHDAKDLETAEAVPSILEKPGSFRSKLIDSYPTPWPRLNHGPVVLTPLYNTQNQDLAAQNVKSALESRSDYHPRPHPNHHVGYWVDLTGPNNGKRPIPALSDHEPPIHFRDNSKVMRRNDPYTITYWDEDLNGNMILGSDHVVPSNVDYYTKDPITGEFHQSYKRARLDPEDIIAKDVKDHNPNDADASSVAPNSLKPAVHPQEFSDIAPTVPRIDSAVIEKMVQLLYGEDSTMALSTLKPTVHPRNFFDDTPSEIESAVFKKIAQLLYGDGFLTTAPDIPIREEDRMPFFQLEKGNQMNQFSGHLNKTLVYETIVSTQNGTALNGTAIIISEDVEPSNRQSSNQTTHQKSRLIVDLESRNQPIIDSQFEGKAPNVDTKYVMSSEEREVQSQNNSGNAKVKEAGRVIT